MQSDGSRHAPGWSEWLDRLARLIPGVGRYQDREGLREMDKQVQVHLASLMTDLGRMVEGEQRRLTDSKRLDRLPALDRVARSL